MRALVGTIASLALLTQLGCSSSDPEPNAPADCAEGNSIGGVCAGLPAGPLCGESVCTVNASCSTIREVSDQASLDAAASSAMAGECIALLPGSYSQALVSGGVSLLGQGADLVTVGYVQVTGGSGTLVQGMSVGPGGIKLDASQDVTIRSVRVQGSSADAIEANAGSSVTVVSSEIHGSARYALSGFDATAVTVEGTIIDGAAGPGMWAQCTGGCSCPGAVDVSLTNTIIRDTKIVGLSLVGVHATLQNVEIRDNTTDTHFVAGGGLAVSECSTVTAVGLSVKDNTNFGILVDDSDVTLGEEGSSTIEVLRNLRGIWVQNIGRSAEQSVSIFGCEVGENDGVGIGVDGESTNVTIREGTIRDTTLIDLPVLVDGVSASSESVGDGLDWFGASYLMVEGVTVSNSARASVLIDGAVAAGSTIQSLALGGGDEQKGILQQNVTVDDTSPSVGTGVPSVRTSASEEFAIATPPAVPPGI